MGPYHSLPVEYARARPLQDLGCPQPRELLSAQ
jgi:hypothetical protein